MVGFVIGLVEPDHTGHVTTVGVSPEHRRRNLAKRLMGQVEEGFRKRHDSREVSGINTRAELAEFENLLRRNTIRGLMVDAGVTFIDPSHSYISPEAKLGRDCVIYPNVSIEGKSVIGEGCLIRSGARITNSILGNNVTVKDHSLIVDSEVGSNCTVGPFAHLRMMLLNVRCR